MEEGKAEKAALSRNEDEARNQPHRYKSEAEPGECPCLYRTEPPNAGPNNAEIFFLCLMNMNATRISYLSQAC